MDRMRAFCFDHRRSLAAALAALAVLTGIDAARPSVTTTDLLVAAHDLDSGRQLTSADLTTIAVPTGTEPAHVLGRREAVGRRVAGPMRQGEPITDRRVVSPRDLGGRALSMVRVEDPASLVGVRVGDQVDVVAASGDGEPRVVVEDAVVTTVPRGDDDAMATVGLTTSSDDALRLADASVDGQLRLIVRA